VYFKGGPRIGCRALVLTRTAAALDEVLTEARQPLTGREDLYELARGARDWPASVPAEETLCVQAIVATRDVAKDLLHTHYSALTVCKAVTDSCRDALGVRPSVDLDMPDWMLNLVLHRGGATLSRRWSGRHGLHRRGYRAGVKMHKAALRETAAAGLLMLAGVRTGEPMALLDPMCGSGTFVLEAAMIASDLSPGAVREALIGPRRWHAVPSEFRGLLKEELDLARARESVPAGLRLRGSDAHAGALALARRCIAALHSAAPGVGRAVDFELRDAADAEPETDASGRRLLCCNPPWGARLAGTVSADAESSDWPSDGPEAARESWRRLADLVHRHGSEAWLLCPTGISAELEKEMAVHTGPASARHRVDGGPRQTEAQGALGLDWLRFSPS